MHCFTLGGNLREKNAGGFIPKPPRQVKGLGSDGERHYFTP
jgi:hypothetical protein